MTAPYSYLDKGTLVYSRDAKLKGRLTGARRRCSLEGCNGLRLTVKWQDGQVTHPCSKGMLFRKRTWRIM